MFGDGLSLILITYISEKTLSHYSKKEIRALIPYGG
jgi:hypothetical protein